MSDVELERIRQEWMAAVKQLGESNETVVFQGRDLRTLTFTPGDLAQMLTPSEGGPILFSPDTEQRIKDFLKKG